MKKERIKAKVADLIMNEGQLGWLPTNPRQWTREDVEKTKASLENDADFTEERPVLVVECDGKLLVFAGNLRTTAARALKWEYISAVLYTPENDEDKDTIKRRSILDNGAFGSWDYDMLANEWDDQPLADWGVPAWDTANLESVSAPKEVEEDDFDETKDHIEVRCKRGDVWQLGDHRLMCGDSVSLDDVKKLMGGAEADMIFTDPPYGIDYSGGRTQTVSKKDYGKLQNDNLQGAELGNLICNIFKFNKTGADVYVCVSPIMQKPFWDYISGEGKRIDAVIVWDKKQPGLGYMAYRRQCEFILFIKGGQFHKGDKSDVDLWSITRDEAQSYVHGTQKPVAVSARAINNSSKEGDVVLDLFGGSGSTLLACEQLNRRCRMMEIDAHFADVIIARWEKFTGKQATKIN